MDRLFWQLVYSDGNVITEPLENASILVAPPGAQVLYIVKRDRTPVLKVDLEKKRPIFYRVRSMAVRTVRDDRGDDSPPPTVRLDATVFGRGWADDIQASGTLWAILGERGPAITCPAALIDKRMLELQIS